jgi:hypothetical protein
MRLGLSVPKILKETFAELRKAVKWARSCRSLRRVLRSAKRDVAAAGSFPMPAFPSASSQTAAGESGSLRRGSKPATSHYRMNP